MINYGSIKSNSDENSFGDDIKLNEEQIYEALVIINEDQKSILDESYISRIYDSQTTEVDEPMLRGSVFKIIEDMMDKKYYKDLAMIKYGKSPQNIPDHIIEYLTRIYGLKNLALKNLNQMIPVLEDLYKQQNHYGIFYCKLLQIFDPNPISYSLAPFLIRARFEFNKLVESLVKKSKLQKSSYLFLKDCINDKKFSYGDSQANIVDVINLIFNLFETDKYCRSFCIDLLKPDEISKEEYFLFRTYLKMMKTNRVSENVFTLIDSKLNGYVTREQLIDGLQKVSEIYLSNSEIEQIFSYFNPTQTGFITRKSFISKLNKNLYDKILNLNLSIKQIDFLLILVEVHKQIQIRDTAFLASRFKSKNCKYLSFYEFEEFVSSIDPNISLIEIQDLFDQGLDLNNDKSRKGLTCESFCKIIIKESIGGKGIRGFRNIYLEIISKTDKFSRVPNSSCHNPRISKKSETPNFLRSSFSNFDQSS